MYSTPMLEKFGTFRNLTAGGKKHHTPPPVYDFATIFHKGGDDCNFDFQGDFQGQQGGSCMSGHDD